MTIEERARLVMERCDILGGYSEEPDRLTRPFATDSMRRVNEVVAAWMQQAGMTVQLDHVGNLIGRYEADKASAKTLLLASHLDSVRNAGKYDGPLGVMVALACVELLNARQQRLPYAIEVLGFADEEGLRYHSAYIGSKAITGTFDVKDLDLIDADGVTLAEAIRQFRGEPDLSALQTSRWQCDELLGYCEVHIEQGPILEQRQIPVAVVSAIAGQNRIQINLTGQAGHAGTVPMSLRHDALCAAAEFVLSVEKLAQDSPGVVATVGQLHLQPGASNVIPGQVSLSLDVRHQDDTVRELVSRQLQERLQEIGTARGVSASWQLLQGNAAVPCAPSLTGILTQAIERVGYPALSLASGAGHDAAILSKLTDIAMLFVRCRAGISHNPAESVTVEDVAVAIAVLEQFLLLLAQEGR